VQHRASSGQPEGALRPYARGRPQDEPGGLASPVIRIGSIRAAASSGLRAGGRTWPPLDGRRAALQTSLLGDWPPPSTTGGLASVSACSAGPN